MKILKIMAALKPSWCADLRATCFMYNNVCSKVDFKNFFESKIILCAKLITLGLKMKPCLSTMI